MFLIVEFQRDIIILQWRKQRIKLRNSYALDRKKLAKNRASQHNK
jgi:hypothetical protein